MLYLFEVIHLNGQGTKLSHRHAGHVHWEGNSERATPAAIARLRNSESPVVYPIFDSVPPTHLFVHLQAAEGGLAKRGSFRLDQQE